MLIAEGGIYDVHVDNSGNMYYVVEYDRLVKRAPDGTESILGIHDATSTPNWCCEGGNVGSTARLGNMAVPSVDGPGDGTLYVTSGHTNTIFRISNGKMYRFAGTPTSSYQGGFSGDGGPALDAQLFFPTGLTYGGDGHIYFIDTRNCRVRKIWMSGPNQGNITTVMGTGCGAYYGEASGMGGPATAAEVPMPVYEGGHIYVDSSGVIYFTNTYNAGQVFKIDTAGIITHFAGKYDPNSNTGDGGPATAAEISQPAGITGDAAGNIYIAADQVIRKVDPNGIITTAFGKVADWFSGGVITDPESGVEVPTSNLAFDAAWGLHRTADGIFYLAGYRKGIYKITPVT